MAPEADPRRAGVPARRRIGFSGHALAEYVLGAALLAAGVHSTGPSAVVLIGVGILLVVLNLATTGRLGAFGLVGRRTHHVADLVLVVALAVSPLIALGRLHALGVLTAEVVALVLFRIERATRYQDRQAGAPGGVLAAGDPPAPPVTSGDGVSLAQRAGAATARSVPQAGRAARRGARNLGVVVGVTRRVTRERYGSGRIAREGTAGSPDA